MTQKLISKDKTITYLYKDTLPSPMIARKASAYFQVFPSKVDSLHYTCPQRLARDTSSDLLCLSIKYKGKKYFSIKNEEGSKLACLFVEVISAWSAYRRLRAGYEEKTTFYDTDTRLLNGDDVEVLL